MIMPGEKARSHRHTPNALRLIIDAEPGAYTMVNGEKLTMMPGDVLLTPNWCWHGHGNEGRACAYWLDVLDVPLVQLLEPMFFEPHPDEFETEIVVPNASPMHFAWGETPAAAGRGRSQGRTASRPRSRSGTATGDVRAGHHGAVDDQAEGRRATAPRKVMANNVFGVVEGEGATEVDGETLRLAPRRRHRGAGLAAAQPIERRAARCCSAPPTSR